MLTIKPRGLSRVSKMRFDLLDQFGESQLGLVVSVPSRLHLLLPAIQAELWFFRGAIHFDSQERPGTVFGEEGIDRFQNPSLPSAHCLRNLRL
jgi:hypothetical protein